MKKAKKLAIRVVVVLDLAFTVATVVSLVGCIIDALLRIFMHVGSGVCWVLLLFSGVGMATFSVIRIVLPLILEDKPNARASACATRSNHGSELSEVMEAIRSERFEYLALFDKNGHKLAEGTMSSPNKCMVAEEDRIYIYDADTMLHNHPGGLLPHSRNDIRFQLKYGIRQSIVVSRRQVYILENPFVDTEEWREDGRYPFGIEELIDSYDQTREGAMECAEKYGLKFYIGSFHKKPKVFTRRVQTKFIQAAIAFVLLLSLIPPLPKSPTVSREKCIPEGTIAVHVYDEYMYRAELPSCFVYYFWSDSAQAFSCYDIVEKTWHGDGPSEAPVLARKEEYRHKCGYNCPGDGKLQPTRP